MCRPSTPEEDEIKIKVLEAKFRREMEESWRRHCETESSKKPDEIEQKQS